MNHSLTLAASDGDLLSTTASSEAARISPILWQNVQAHSAMKSLVPPSGRTGPAGALMHNERNYVAMRIATALKRAGANVASLGAPFALSVMEKLDFCPPETAEVHVDCRANGYLCCYVGGEAPEVAVAAGASIFRMTFNVAAMRAEFRAAVDAARTAPRRPVVAGTAIEVDR